MDIKIGQTIKAIRERKRIKQYSVAISLALNQSTYSRMEKGLQPITIGQLNIIAVTLRTTPVQILLETQDYSGLSAQPKIFIERLITTILLVEQEYTIKDPLEEKEFILSKINQYYEKKSFPELEI
ncbi:MAG: helix-turn-helix transcriptional regulator [Bacteroidetes bacterium]|nr:helix-turn-helix transcriptional regulator [Bacteroidota bacterium]